MEEQNIKKPKIVFAFVEAGMGHMIPMKAISDAFEEKYGDRAEIIRTKFFQDTKNSDMKYVEDELIREVKKHNKNRINGFIQFLALRLFGSRLSMKYLHEIRYKKGFEPSIEYLKELDADVVFNTHFSTLYYAAAARRKGLIDSKIITYCTDPIIGRQWDNRGDLIALSSSAGKRKALNSFRYRNKRVEDVPFLIRKEIKAYDKGKEYYKKELGLPANQFTVLAADGAYGAGKLKNTVFELLKSKQKLTIIAVCGKNEQLYQEFSKINPPENIVFRPYGFTDKMLTFAAACDLFVGKAGNSNLAEPAYFGVPQIVTFCATPVEKWICRHYVEAGCAVKVNSVKKAVTKIESWAKNPTLMEKYIIAAKKQSRCDGPDILADIIWETLNN